MLGLRLKQLRLEKNKTQKDVANNLKITTSSYGFYEQDKRTPDAEMLKKIAEYFSVSLDYLLGHSNIRNPYENRDLRNKDKTLTQDKKLKDDLIDLMIRQGIIKDKDSVNEKHLEFIEFAIETYKNEQNNK